MANNIQIKRKGDQSAPTGLLAGELAWSDNNAVSGSGGAAGYLYIGDLTTGTAVNRKIGGPGWALEILTDSILTGNPTAPTATAGDNDTSVATTAYADTAVANHVDAATQSQGNNSLKIATTAYVDLAVANAEIDFLTEIGDVTLTNAADGDVILWNSGTSQWENKVMTGHVSIDETGDTIVSNVAADAVTLGSQTTGAYVATITAGDNIVVTGSGGESAATTIALDTNVTIAGNLTVSGMTTTVDSTTVSVADPVFVIGEAGASDDGKDRGIEFNYYDGSAKTGYFGWDNSADAFTFISDASNNNEVFTGNAGNVAFGDIAGTLTTAAQPNITGLGTITSGVWSSTFIGQLYGGTGGDSSNATGVAVVTGGQWSYETNLDVPIGGTGLSTVSTDGILLGNGVGNMTVLAVGTAGQKLAIGAGGSPEWSDTFDGGTW